MDRQKYNTCMIPYITGKKPVEQRRLDFCIGAKVCSGKASSDEEAKTICLSQPAESKPSQPRKKKDSCDFNAIAACAAPRILQHILKTDIDITAELLAGIFEQCNGKKTTSLSREKFIKKCFKENSSNGTTQVDLKEAAQLRSFCIKQYEG